MNEMTAQEFEGRRAMDIELTADEMAQSGTAPPAPELNPDQDVIDAMSTREYLMARTKETIMVSVSGMGGVKDIEIRARLSKLELKPHEYILDRWKVAQETNIKFIDTENDEKVLCALIAYITIDPEITTDFLLDSGLSPDVCDDILAAYFILEPTRRMVDIQKFLGERLRAGIRANASDMGD